MTMNPLRVAHFNTFPYGGAATAAMRIHRQLRSPAVNSQFYYHRDEQQSQLESGFHQINFAPPKPGLFAGTRHRGKQKKRQRKIYKLYNQHIALRPADVETFSMAELPEPTELNWNAIDADVVHLHWISFLADYPSFFESIPDHVPIVWTLHDMNAFTGGCHYTNGCTRFQHGCGGCKQVTNSGPHDVSAASFVAKRESLKNKQIHVVTPSEWMRENAMKSDIWPDSTTFQTIHYGLDLQTFSPAPQRLARQTLGLPTDSAMIAFGAEDINNKRKGFQHLLPALTNLDTNQQVECIVFGSGEIEPIEGLPKIHHMGYVDSVKQQSLIYSAADLVVVPSREDNQPQVGLESMACGTPVVGFDAGGIPEYVRNLQTGLVAKIGDEQALAEKISWLINHESDRLEMGTQARAMVELEFEADIQSHQYASLYQSLASPRQAHRVA